MTMADVLALLVGAALGWASGALKAHLHSLRRPQAPCGREASANATSQGLLPRR
jgi:hypothetical protein